MRRYSGLVAAAAALLALAGCDSFSLTTLLGDARHSGDPPLQIEVSGSPDYPLTPESPAILLVRPDFAGIQEGLLTLAPTDGTYLVYEDDLRDKGLGTDAGYLINVLYDGNGNFMDDKNADSADIIGVYDITQGAVLSVSTTQFTRVFAGTLVSLTVDFPEVAADGGEPQNSAPDDTPTVTSGEAAYEADRTLDTLYDEDWFEHTTGAIMPGTYRFETLPTPGQPTIDTGLVVCDDNTCSADPIAGDDDSGALGTYSAVEIGLAISQVVYIGIARGGGSPFGYYDFSVSCLDC